MPSVEGRSRMTRKDPSPVDLENAEREVDTPMSRRSLVTLAGAAGIGGLAAALVVDRTALAAPTDDVQPNIPTAADIAVLEQVIGLELAASALYRARLAASDDLASAVGVMAENHQAFAQAISGATGLPASQANDDIVDEYLAGFTGSDTDFFTAAHTLEQIAAATHTELLSVYESEDAIKLTAAIAVTEARHATVLADLLGVDDLDVLFGNAQSALSLEGNS
ncbi:MAG: ferritin-like domain-containing protein [Ilumatobacter sp.]